MRKTRYLLCAFDAVYRQRAWHWYWEAWKLKPPYQNLYVIDTADHEGEDPSRTEWLSVSQVADIFIRLDLVFDGWRTPCRWFDPRYMAYPRK